MICLELAVNQQLYKNTQAQKTHNPENWIICMSFKQACQYKDS